MPRAKRADRGTWALLPALPLLILAVLAGLILLAGPTAAETDSDGDGFTDSAELYMGTDPITPCNVTSVQNDEAIDAWPPDLNNDTKVDIADVVPFRTVYGSISGDGTYDPRLDLNADGKINIIDVVLIRAAYGTACQPTSPPPAPLPAGSRIPWQGDEWYLQGANVPWYNWGCDFGCGQNGGVSSPTVQSALEGGFSQLQASGVHVARWWVFPGDPWQITRDASGVPTGINPTVYADFDAALELAEQYDLYYVFTLFSSPNAPGAWVTDPAQRAKLTEVLGELFARYGDNPRVLSWQVFNEPEWQIWNGQVEQASVQATVRDIAAAVHANSNAYVSVGSAKLAGLPMWLGLGLDYYTAHWYDPMTGGSCALCTDYAEVKDRFNLDAPLVIGEFFAGPSVDALQRFEDWYAKGYAGAWAWSLFSDRTNDGMSIDLAAAQTFADQHADIGPEAPSSNVAVVGQWGRFEASVTNTNSYTDPYNDVSLDVTYTRPGGGVVDFWGFYDGGTTWKIRFMCDQIGTWSYDASFSDGAPGISGQFDCVASTIPGMLSKDETNPMWFGFKGGEHVLIRSFHVGDRFFAENWSSGSRSAFLDWAQQQGYNTLSIASHYLNRNKSGRGAGWDTPDLWDGSAGRPKAEEYQKLEALLDELADRRIMVFPFAGFFGKNSDRPTNQTLQTQYIRYTLARLGSYWNVLLNVAGPELGGMSTSNIDRLGEEINWLDVFDHPLSVHNLTGDDPFKNSTWSSYVTLQGPKTKNRSTLSSGLRQNHHPSKPLYAQETLWPGNKNHPNYNETDIRKNAYVIMMSAAALNFADMDGNSSSGFSGSMNLSERNQNWHDIVKMVWDFFETVPFYRMSPCQNLVNNGFCLAEVGQEYLVYLQSPGTVDVSIQGGPYSVEWINAQDTSDRRSAGTTSNGQNLASPGDGDDWLLRLTR